MYDIYQQSALGVKKCKVNKYVEYELRGRTGGYSRSTLFIQRLRNKCFPDVYLRHFVQNRHVIDVIFNTNTLQITHGSHETGVFFCFYKNLIICSSFVCEILPLCVWQKEWKGKSGFSNPGPEGGD